MRLSKVLKTLRSQLQRKPSLNPTLTAQTPPPQPGAHSRPTPPRSHGCL